MSYLTSVQFGIGLIQHPCVLYRTQRKVEEMHLQNDYDKVTKMFESDPIDLNKIRLNEIKEKLELFYQERFKGIIICARPCWYEHGERSSKYFFIKTLHNIFNRQEKECIY